MKEGKSEKKSDIKSDQYFEGKDTKKVIDRSGRVFKRWHDW